MSLILHVLDVLDVHFMKPLNYCIYYKEPSMPIISWRDLVTGGRSTSKRGICKHFAKTLENTIENPITFELGSLESYQYLGLSWSCRQRLFSLHGIFADLGLKETTFFVNRLLKFASSKQSRCHFFFAFHVFLISEKSSSVFWWLCLPFPIAVMSLF